MKRIWRQICHGIFGHPRHEIDWGETVAKCSCGVEFTLFDLYPFM